MDFNPNPVDNNRARWPRPALQSLLLFLTGWRCAAVFMVLLTGLLALVLLGTLLLSLYGLDGSSKAIGVSTLLFRGHCEASTQYNFWAHLAINFVASGVLASSNFFMQVLVAPTRADVDRAHAKGRALEIGVQSWRNLFHVRFLHRAFWILLAISTVPLHLIFNSTIMESKASTDFIMLMTSDKFLEGAPWDASSNESFVERSVVVRRVGDIQRSLSEQPSLWERMNMEDCFAMYNDFSRGLASRRDVVMVLELDTSNPNVTGTFGWIVNGTAENSLWYRRTYQRTDSFINAVAGLPEDFTADESFGSDSDGAIAFEAQTYSVRNKAPKYPKELGVMKAQYCMSELWTAPCEVTVDNSLLLIVVIICLVKSTLCVGTLLATARGAAPLITPGDAIESFITKPDATTAGMCTFSCVDFNQQHSKGGRRDGYRWLPAARPWSRRISRRSIFAVPKGIWIWSYLIMGVSLVAATSLLGLSVPEQSISESQFGHAPVNKQIPVYSLASPASMVVLANTPQLVLSMCYFALNGLYTRILSEWEWAKLSTTYRSLRVTHRYVNHRHCRRSSYDILTRAVERANSDRLTAYSFLTAGHFRSLLSAPCYTGCVQTACISTPSKVSSWRIRNALGTLFFWQTICSHRE
jgi:hypothetical protein